MSNVESRPFRGTWVLNNRTVVKYTPDALVFINGDTSLPGCARCRGRIEVQKFVTGLSVEAGTDPTSHSATINLALPRVQGKQVFIDGENILRAGLEVHVFMRGYFPVRGMFSHLANKQSGPSAGASPSDTSQFDLSKYATYPYYPVFHGLITQVSYEYSDGFYYGTLNCTSLLHFWQYVNITTAGAWMAQDKRPVQDLGRPTLYGHNFNNTHPFSIIYTLYRDVAGSAAGVDFALGEATNLDASVGASMGDDGRQIFSMVSLYWTQRFKTRIQNLRMYGVNGQLFNGVQQAWLGKNRDVNGLLTSSTANDPTTTSSVRDPFAARYSVAKSLGLQGAGADFTFSPLIQQDNEFFNLSVLDMYAFNQSIADMGANNLWQTTYQTKMDIAQRVMEVTGYEFYQDVDGDLVFKPPFWNLDTAPNRYYRLEDSDIINITFTEKEPNATYIIVRGVWVPGLTDVTPPDDVLTKRGLYIDYKLVAQFGWRPAPTLELTYVIDPKVLFWIGVARLDTLNVNTFSATATIPIRAELRPGFPVYIPFADCYYYITQLSHSFAFGGQCTTSLVLTCRRAKFHAPGLLGPLPPGRSAIEAIRLDRPDLPPRPLEAFVNDVPRLVGFPNVVMALDVAKFNPNFSPVGIGIDYFDSVDAPADLLWSLLVKNIHLQDVFEIDQPAEGVDGNWFIEDPSQVTKLKFRTAKNQVIRFSVEDLRIAFTDLRSAQAPLQQAQTQVNKQSDIVAEKDRNYNAFKLAQKAGGKTKGNPGSDRASATDRLDVLEGELQNELVRYNDVVESSPSISTLVQIFEALQPDSNEPIRRKIDGIPGSDVRLSYFETLSHLKGQYMAGSVPGNYRYYSCSHPDPKQQGMPIVTWSDGQRAKAPIRSQSRGSRRRSNPLDNTPVTQEARNRRERFRAERNSLQGRLSARGVTWISASDYLDDRNRGITWLKSGKVFGQESVKNAPLTEGVADNLVNLGVATQELFDRLAADPNFGGRGLSVGPGGKSWAVGAQVESSGDASQHAAGRAHDIGVIDSSGNRTNEGFDVLTATAGQMWAEGWFGGFGTYVRADNLSAKSFIHVDIRPGNGRWGDRKDSKGNRFTSGGGDSEVKSRIKAEKQAAFEAAGVTKKNRTNPKLWEQKAPTPQVEDVVADVPMMSSENTVQETPALERPPTIDTREIGLEVPRTVVQFKPTTKSPGGNRRAPEVILGIGKCRQGIQIATGPNRTPQVLTTDQVQRIHFVRHEAGKFMEVVGTSQNSGSLSFNGIGLQKQITDLFKVAIQDLEDPNVTVASIFQPIYDQMATDLESVDIPRYDPETGDLVVDEDDNNIKLIPFGEALVVAADQVPSSVASQLAAQGVTTTTVSRFGDAPVYSLGPLTFKQVALLPGYKTSGDVQDNGQSWQRPASAVASAYATSVTKQIENGNGLASPNNWPGYLTVTKNASTPLKDKSERLTSISEAFNNATTKAFGAPQAQEAQLPNTTTEVATKEGIVNTPVHSPVFPVSDEKGYQHYGAYRYGRGLSVEPGGTFEFIHSGKDPFRNVTAQSAEEFLRVLTLVKTGRVDGDTSLYAGIKRAALDVAQTLFGSKQDPLSTEGLSEDVAAQGGVAQTTAEATVGNQDVVRKVGLSDLQRGQVEQSAQDLAITVTRLNQTARGQDVLRELLQANGDDPNILDGQSFDITDTQFLRNYVNFAANFGQSPVFKTTAANAAYRLADLTAHLLNRTGQACICRGSYADVTMEAYSRENFIAPPGIDTQEEKAESYAGEEAIKRTDPWSAQQKRVTGAHSGTVSDASSFQDGRTAGAGVSGTFGTGGDAGTVSAENPPTTDDATAGGGGGLNQSELPISSTDEAIDILAQEFDKEAIFLEETGDVEQFVDDVGPIIEGTFPLSELQAAYAEDGAAGLQQLIDEANAELGEGETVRFDVAQLEAYLYLKSSQIEEQS